MLATPSAAPPAQMPPIRNADSSQYPSSPAALNQLIPIAPGRKLGPLRPANAYEIEAFRQTCEPDVLGGKSGRRLSILALAVFDGFPPLFDR